MQKLDSYMQQVGFVQKAFTYQWEMAIVLYIQVQKQKYLTGKIHTSTKACGFANMFGNKGGMNL